MTKRSPFQRALDAAEKRLKKATQERAACQDKERALAREIPDLEKTITALKHQLGQSYVAITSENPIKIEYTTGAPGPDLIVPPELAKYAMPQDLSGMGSVPAVKGPAVKELTEDELLPDEV